MDRSYISVKRADQRKYGGLLYESKIDGLSRLHYDACSLLHSVASQIASEEFRNRVITLHDRIPESEATLRKTLDVLVTGHNLAVTLGRTGQIPGERKARKVLSGRT